MTRTLKLTLAAVAAIAIAFPALAAAQGSIAVDPTLAKRGKTLFANRGCSTCHWFGKKLAGPDLAGVMERRDHGWLRRWLRNTDEMIASDSLARAMVAEYNNTKMPNLKLQDADVDALFHYFQQETMKVRSK
jgi:mono/diheme cytochrome c family protein